MKTANASRTGVTATALLLLWLLASTVAAPAAEPQGDDPILARAYTIRHRPLADAAELVGPLLSADGEMVLKLRLKTLMVVDRVSVLDRVEALLDSFDLPPRDVELTLTLILGTDESRSGAGRLAMPDVSLRVIDVMERMREVTKWNHLELLGSRSISAVEGGKVTATVSKDYRVVFEIDTVEERENKVRFKNFAVQKIVPTADGGVRYEDIYAADIVSPLGRLSVVGAASGPESNKALFLTLQAELR